MLLLLLLCYGWCIMFGFSQAHVYTCICVLVFLFICVFVHLCIFVFVLCACLHVCWQQWWLAYYSHKPLSLRGNSTNLTPKTCRLQQNTSGCQHHRHEYEHQGNCHNRGHIFWCSWYHFEKHHGDHGDPLLIRLCSASDDCHWHQFTNDIAIALLKLSTS